MRIPAIFFFSLVLTAVVSCGTNNSANEVQTYKNDSIVFFQANDFFAEQINAINKTPYFIYKTYMKEGKTDSLPVSITVFDSLATFFSKYNISDAHVKKYYKESAFNDESTHSITLSYSTTNKALPVQSMDVLLNQETHAVKRIFITINESVNDTVYLYKLSWKADDNFSIMKSVTTKKGELTDQTTVRWK